MSLPAQADIYVLANDGQVRGELNNTDESPRQKYVILTPEGVTVTLDRGQVKQIIPQSAAEIEFEKIRPTFADTAEDQWKLAEWCRENSLTSQRQDVLEHVIELNPDMRQARLALGYQQVDGHWMQKEQIMQQRGYVRYKGEWRLPQEVELIERRQKEDAAERQWFGTLKRWRMLAGRIRPCRSSPRFAACDPRSARRAGAAASIAPFGARSSVRMLYVQALAAVGTPAAMRTLVDHSLDDGDEEIRLACLDRIVGQPTPEIVAAYVAALKSDSNVRINRAARALGRLGDKSAVGPLIDSLVTTHVVQEGAENPNSDQRRLFAAGRHGVFRRNRRQESPAHLQQPAGARCLGRTDRRRKSELRREGVENLVRLAENENANRRAPRLNTPERIRQRRHSGSDDGLMPRSTMLHP